MGQPYRERREILELLQLGAGHVLVRFDGDALWQSVCGRGLVPARERGWIKGQEPGLVGAMRRSGKPRSSAGVGRF